MAPSAPPSSGARFDDPRGYFPEPAPLEPRALTSESSFGRTYRHLTFASEYEPRGVVFVAASRDDPSIAKVQVGMFIDQRAPALARHAAYADEGTADAYAVSAIPTMVLIDRKGHLQASYVGAANERTWRARIEAALALDWASCRASGLPRQESARHFFGLVDGLSSSTRNSTLRFFARPSAVALSAIGRSNP